MTPPSGLQLGLGWAWLFMQPISATIACGAEVDSLGTHGLSCRHSEGWIHRHAYINDIIHQALSSTKIPSRFEPTGLLRSDGKQPDSIWSCCLGNVASCLYRMPPALIELLLLERIEDQDSFAVLILILSSSRQDSTCLFNYCLQHHWENGLSYHWLSAGGDPVYTWNHLHGLKHLCGFHWVAQWWTGITWPSYVQSSWDLL